MTIMILTMRPVFFFLSGLTRTTVSTGAPVTGSVAGIVSAAVVELGSLIGVSTTVTTGCAGASGELFEAGSAVPAMLVDFLSISLLKFKPIIARIFMKVV